MPPRAPREIAPWLRRLTTWLDTACRVPGTSWRFGIDPLLGLIPVVGDWLGVALSASTLIEAKRLAVRRRVWLRMLANLGLEASIGAIPVLGDLWDAWFKANRRNLRLLEREIARDAGADEHRPRDGARVPAHGDGAASGLWQRSSSARADSAGAGY